jgi:hypothetical protein
LGCVKKINTVQELEQYAIRAFDFLVQDLIPFQNGIFYVRYQMKKRKNTGIVSKEFLLLLNGLASVEELIKLNPRYELQLEVKQRCIKLLEVYQGRN